MKREDEMNQRVSLKIDHKKYSFIDEPAQDSHGRDGLIKRASWLGRSISIGDADLNTGSLIDFLNIYCKFKGPEGTELKKGWFFGYFGDRKKTVIKRFHDYIDSEIAKQGNALTVEGAIKIQAIARGYLARKQYRSLKEAVIKIQAIRRGCLKRKQYRSLKKAAIKIEALIRSYLARKKQKGLSLLAAKEIKKIIWSRTLNASSIKAMKPKELIELLLEDASQGSREQRCALLKKVLQSYPTFSLSPFNVVRQRILEDKQLELRNEFLEHYHLTEEERQKCYEFAFKMHHPYIYEVSAQEIPDQNYSLNFVWVNLNPQDRVRNLAQNIFGEELDSIENEEELKKTFTFKLSKWAEKNPHAEINLWYDSTLVTEKARTNTFAKMQHIAQQKQGGLHLRDVRRLPILKEMQEIEHLFHPGTPVYFRVDLLKALITDYMLDSTMTKKPYCVVSDIDVEPMNKKEIFDKRTLESLRTVGYVFNAPQGMGEMENNFFIFHQNSAIAKLREAHKYDLITSIVDKAKEWRNWPHDPELTRANSFNSQSVFTGYIDFTRRVANSEDYPAGEEAVSAWMKGLRVKPVNTPPSQFNMCWFQKADHQGEFFRFIGEDNVPYVKDGRAYAVQNKQGQKIKALEGWKAEALEEE
jgi:hypothetical protein